MCIRDRLNARYLASSIAAMDPFRLLSNGEDLPVFAFTLEDNFKDFSLYDLSDRLRGQGWQVPAYTLPPNLEEMVVMRIVVKENLSRDMATTLIKDIKQQVAWLRDNPLQSASQPRQSFHH